MKELNWHLRVLYGVNDAQEGLNKVTKNILSITLLKATKSDNESAYLVD